MGLLSYFLPGLASFLALLLVCQAIPRLNVPRPAHPVGMEYGLGMGGLCRAMCSGNSMECPPECAFSRMVDWVKRGAQRTRRFEDFSFDDILFMKLLGRNLGERN